MFTRVKGTQDFLDLSLFNFFVNQAKKHMALYNFTEIATPIIEHTDLFKRSLGDETDVVTKEMYTLNTEEAICLRPEATASTVRAFVNAGIQTTPWKVYTWGPVFRHERPQKGRYRQFHQFNIEVIGADSITQDAQYIKMLERLFADSLKLTNYALLINFVGDESDRLRFKEVLREHIATIKQDICATCTVRVEKNILRIFDCKNETCQLLYKKAPYITNHLSEKSAAEFAELKQLLESLSVSYCHVPTLVRGLDYYDKTVFEFVSTDLGAQNAFCGGGRYNKLVKHIGAKNDHAAIGSAIGIERIMMLLEPIKDTLPYNQQPPLHVVVPFTAEQKRLALIIADELQAHNLATEVLLENDSVKSMMRQANKMGAKYALLIGPDEQEQKAVVLKNMFNAVEERVMQKDIVSKLTL